MDRTLPLHNLQDTIIAAATGPAPGALSLLRLSGPRASAIAGTLLRSPGGGSFSIPEPRRAVLARVEADGKLIDRAVVVYFKAPASFTGDDVIEIACHGSPYITARAIAAAIAAGARTAEPGEFSMRAFFNGKMDLAQAEGLCDLILAKTEAAHRAALRITEGALSDRFQSIKDKILALLAETEARIDDADEEIPPINKAAVARTLESVKNNMAKLAATFELGRFMKEGVRTAIVGSPNCGKSSLLNALLGFDRAIVAPTPGTTRDTIEETADIKGFQVILTDTAGIREKALDPAEQEGIRRTRRAIDKSDLVLFVQDAQSGFSASDKEVWELVGKAGKPFLCVINKTDTGPAKTLPPGINGQDLVFVSCATSQGLPELKNKIAGKIPVDDMDENSAVLTSARHLNALLAAKTEVENAERIFGQDEPALEIAALHLNGALRELEGIVGVTAAEDVLREIFSRFCVGK
ncbi:MAG: tRNA uridine-5-carboxymethylaminomethyl(34) synthesis GTPase MnmE [Elusimicrobiaceae bacterium]